MRTRSSSNPPIVSPPNPSTSNPKCRNRRRSKQPFILEESPVDTMADQRTMAELLHTPTEGTTNLRNEISNFQQRFDESFHEAWDRYKDLFRACPHHGFTELHQLESFYNALNPADQDSLNAAAGGNRLERCTQDVLTIIENKSKFQATPPPAFVKIVEEIYVTCGGAHPYYQCLAAGGNTFPEPRDNIQGYIAVAVVNYNQGSFVYRPTAVILKKLLEKLRDPGKFLIPCGFSELKCKALADLGASINLMPLSVWKKLGLPELISTHMTLELANRAVCTSAGIARDVFVSVGKFTFLANFVIINYESDPRVPLILGRPFLRTARALIGVNGEEMILRDGDERLTLNMRHDTSSYSNQPQKESINLINVFNNSSEDSLEDLFSTNQPSGNPTFSSHPKLTSSEVNDDIFDLEGGNVLSEKFIDLDSTKDLHPPLHVNPLSGITTYSSSPNQLLEEFADELALITFPPEYDDDLQFDFEFDLKEIEYLLHHDPINYIDSILKDSIDQSNLANLNDNFVDFMPEIFTDEHAIDYSSPPLFDEYDDDFFEVESNTENVYDDPFDSKGEKIKESKLLIDELDLLCDFLPTKYDSFIFEDFSRVDALPSTNNEDKVFKLDTPSVSVDTHSVFVSRKKAPVTSDKSKEGPNELKGKSTNTSKGTSVKPEVPDVSTTDSYDSENESWGDSGDDEKSDDVSDDDGNDDDSDNDYGDNDSDDVRTESDEDKNDNDQEEEYVRTLENYESTNEEDEHVDEEDYEELYKDMNTPSLLTIPVTVIPETSTTATTTVPPSIPLITHLLQLSTPTPTPTLTPTTEATKTSIPDLPDYSFVFQFNQRVSNLEKELSQLKQADQSAQLLETIKSQIPAMVVAHLCTRLEDSIQKAFQSYTKEFKKKAQDERKKYTDLIEKLMKDIINDEVKTQLPQIIPKEVFDFATPVIKSTITESLEDVVLVKSFSQPQSMYEAAKSLTEFKLKKILIDKMERDLFEVYGKAVSLKRGREDKDKDEDPLARSDQGMKRRKKSKYAEP
nr:reverse transcriptase domain-containing protein [Tanacetum cinerariifolium]